MKHIRKFNESNNQLIDASDARVVINKYYNVIDEIKLGYGYDFLVEANSFISNMEENDGFIAGNKFNNIDEIIEIIYELDSICGQVYIAPSWYSRFEEDIKSEDVYSDTIYIPYIEGVTGEDGSPMSDKLDFLGADELDTISNYGMVSKSRKEYIRIWWD